MRVTDVLALVIVAGWWTGLARAMFGGTPAYAGALDLTLIALCAWVVAASMKRGELRRGDVVLSLLIVGYLMLAGVQVFNPNVPSAIVGLEGYRKTAFTMIAFFVVALNPGGSAARFYHIVVLGSLIPIAWGVRQFFGAFPVEVDIVGTSDASFITFHSGPVLRAFSPTAGPFHYGILSGSIAIIALVFARMSRWWLIPASIAGLALALSLTRANLIGTLVAIALVSVIASRRGTLAKHALNGTVVAVAIMLGLGLGTGIIGDPPTSAVRETLATPAPEPTDPPASGSEPTDPPASGSEPTLQPAPSPSSAAIDDIVEGVTDPLSDTNLRFRLEYWADHMRALLERPLIGYGTSSAGDGFGHFYEGTDLRHFAPHSLYLKPALELGILGLILLVAIFGRTAWCLVQLPPRGSPMGVISVGVLALLTVSGLTGPMLDAYPFNVLFWATVGWIAASFTDIRDAQLSGWAGSPPSSTSD